MILYTIVPLEVVFGKQQETTDSRRFEIDYLGRRVEVTVDESGRYKISRIISTSPNAYLDPRLQPGMVIK